MQCPWRHHVYRNHGRYAPSQAVATISAIQERPLAAILGSSPHSRRSKLVEPAGSDLARLECWLWQERQEGPYLHVVPCLLRGQAPADNGLGAAYNFIPHGIGEVIGISAELLADTQNALLQQNQNDIWKFFQTHIPQQNNQLQRPDVERKNK